MNQTNAIRLVGLENNLCSALGEENGEIQLVASLHGIEIFDNWQRPDLSPLNTISQPRMYLEMTLKLHPQKILI